MLNRPRALLTRHQSTSQTHTHTTKHWHHLNMCLCCSSHLKRSLYPLLYIVWLLVRMALQWMISVLHQFKRLSWSIQTSIDAECKRMYHVMWTSKTPNGSFTYEYDKPSPPPITSQVSIISGLIRKLRTHIHTHTHTCLLFVCVMHVCVSMMLFRVLTASLLCVLTSTQIENVQEKLFLRSMGLWSRPKPSAHRPVPSQLWKMFRRSAETSRTDSCVVSEYGVRGNIVRFVQDQGELYSHLSVFRQRWFTLFLQAILSCQVKSDKQELAH